MVNGSKGGKTAQKSGSQTVVRILCSMFVSEQIAMASKSVWLGCLYRNP
jgi:hypothetical protein